MYLFSDIAVFCLIRFLSDEQKQRDTLSSSVTRKNSVDLCVFPALTGRREGVENDSIKRQDA